jgi:serine/threonine protein kinase
LCDNPGWWTPTTKAKAIAGIALGMQFAHQLGIVHGSLKPTNILFDENHCVHIADFGSKHFQSKLDKLIDADDDEKVEEVFSFASIVLYILVGRDMIGHSLPFDEEENQKMNNGELPVIPGFVPKFIRELIEDGWSQDRSMRSSFDSIIDILKENNFNIVAGVDNSEVLEFVDLIETSNY